MSRTHIISMPGSTKTESFRQYEVTVWKTVLESLALDILGKAGIRIVAGAAIVAGTARAAAMAINRLVGKKVLNENAVTKNGAICGALAALGYSATQVNWPKLAKELGFEKAIPAVEKAIEQQEQRRIEEILGDFGCNSNTSRGGFERQFKKQIDECRKQDSAAAKIDELMYEAGAQEIRQWFNSRREFY